jgi:hypothetical protein
MIKPQAGQVSDLSHFMLHVAASINVYQERGGKTIFIFRESKPGGDETSQNRLGRRKSRWYPRQECSMFHFLPTRWTVHADEI